MELTKEELKKVLFEESRKRFTPEDVALLEQACELSSKYASNFSFNGESIKIDSYLHSLKTAVILEKELRLDVESVIAAVLMYCEENEDIINISRQKTRSIVERIRKIFGLEVNYLEMNADYFRQLLVNISEDLNVLVICLVDRLVSLSELLEFPIELQDKFCMEVNELFGPLAHRIGLYSIYTELSNRSFEHFHKDEYNRIDKIRNEQLALNQKKIEDFVKSIELLLKENGYNFNIKYRVKSPFSIWNKIENKHVSFDEIYDLFAVRVIFELPDSEIDNEIKSIDAKIEEEDKFNLLLLEEIGELDTNQSLTDERRKELERRRKDVLKHVKSSKVKQKELLAEKQRREEQKAHEERAACWKIYALVTNKYEAIVSRNRDWVSKPRENGYESLHTTLKVDNTFVELQIRSKRMDKIAEYGLAAHWQYKEKSAATSIEKWLAKVRSTLEEDKFVIGNVLDEFKHDSEKDEILVFTPDKELRRLPAESTVLDFAYEIHSQVGNRCVGGIINGKQIVEEVNGRTVKRIEGGVNVDKAYKIQNGETISIRTSKNQKPSLDWMKIAVTNKAKYNIRKSLDEDYHEKVDEGKEILKRKLKNWKYDFTETFNDIVNHFGYKFGNELFFDIATEKLNTLKIKNYLDNKSILDEEIILQNEVVKPPEKTLPYGNKNADLLYRVDDNKIVRGEETKCCENIMRGEEVFGFFSSTGEIKIHRMSCPNAVDLKKKFPYRIVELRWGKI